MAGLIADKIEFDIKVILGSAKSNYVLIENIIWCL